MIAAYRRYFGRKRRGRTESFQSAPSHSEEYSIVREHGSDIVQGDSLTLIETWHQPIASSSTGAWRGNESSSTGSPSTDLNSPARSTESPTADPLSPSQTNLTTPEQDTSRTQNVSTDPHGAIFEACGGVYCVPHQKHFGTRQQYNKHYNQVHSRRFPCDLCQEKKVVFGLRRDLFRHQRTAHVVRLEPQQEILLICPRNDCSYEVKGRMDNFARHLRQKHRMDETEVQRILETYR